jgi:5-methylcytosine-specific restriction endonuclease McrA
VSGRYSEPAYYRARLGVLAAAGWRCQMRGPTCTGLATTVDHIVPLINGGTHDATNLRAACQACNCRGGALIVNSERRAINALGRRSRRW